MKSAVMDINLETLLQHCRQEFGKLSLVYLSPTPSLELKAAMNHALQNGGKYLRPLLIYATGLTFGVPLIALDGPAYAVHLIHTYSLIHDDLPCMDDADLRRGQPACHKVYGEGVAVLTGDALHTLAMQILASHPTPLSFQARLKMISMLSQACGPFGMAAGQALDITYSDETPPSKDLLHTIYQLKTGALITACIQLGWLAREDDNDRHQQALLQLGKNLGMAFQIQDDLLDILTPTDITGKPQGIDKKNGKISYPLLCGVEAAQTKVEFLYQESLEAINYLGNQAQLLRELIQYMLHRKT